MNDSKETLLIGIDGGGTGCRAAIAFVDRVVLSEAEGGPANVVTGFDLALENIQNVIEKAALKAGIEASRLVSANVHLGLAGVMSDAMADRIARSLPYNKVTVTDDRPTAIAGAFAGSDGYLLAVGTGTIIASAQKGKMRYVGGWGFYVADQASGAWLGRRLLEEVMLCYDGVKPHSELTRSVLKKFENDPNEIVAFSVKARPIDFGKMAPSVVFASKEEDPVGVSILREGASYLENGLRALDFHAGSPLCLTGGIGPFYQPYLSSHLTENVVAPLGSSVSGAIYLAAQNAQSDQEVLP